MFELMGVAVWMAEQAAHKSPTEPHWLAGTGEGSAALLRK